ncbi:MAG: flagellar hook-length control protein FliK [Pseudomonadota bacterium]
MNAAVQAGPAANVLKSTNPAAAASDPAAAAAEAALPDGGFKEVLEKRMQFASAAGDAAPASPGDAQPVLVDTPVQLQMTDSNRIASDAMVAFLASQPAPGAPFVPVVPVDPVDPVDPSALPDPLMQSMARVPLSAWARPVGDGAAGAELVRSAQAPAAAVLEPEPHAAIGAAAGKALPQAVPDPAAALRGLLAEASAATRAGDPVFVQPAAVDAVPGTTGGVLPASAAPAAPGASDVRIASTQVATPFGRPEWANAMNERVTWLVGQRMQSADIQITPPQLGPVEVRITIQNDQANVYFTAQSSAVREAIQAALPRLNEMLAQGGLSLGQASVGAESFAGQQQASRDGNGRRPAPEGLDVLPAMQATALPGQAGATALRGRAGIDMFV